MKTSIETEVLKDEQGNPIGGGLLRIKIKQVIEGNELIDYLTKVVNSSIDVVKERMSGYNSKSLFDTWLHFVRQIEEFINIRYEFATPYEEDLKRIHLERKSELEEVSSIVAKNFGKEVNARFLELADLFTGYTPIDSSTVKTTSCYDHSESRNDRLGYGITASGLNVRNLMWCV